MTQETNTTQTTENTTPAAPEVKLTRRQRLEKQYTDKRAKFDKLQAELTEIVAEITSIDALANVAVGTLVLINIGKGESAVEVQGTVIGVREDEDGAKQYKVAYGTGFDADVKVVGSAKLKLAPTEVPADQAAE